jgi:hypothetical protein
MLKFFRFCLLIPGMVIISGAWPGDANAELIKGYPDALVCTAGERKFVFHLNQIQKSGSAIFMEQGGQYVTWKEDGTVIRNDKPFPNCEPRTYGQ